MGVRGRIERWARGLKRDLHAIHLASRDPRVPWTAKLLALLVAAYALSPIDLIPDIVPVLGLLDDLVLVPLGVLLVVRMVPTEIMAEHRAAAAVAPRPVSRAGAAVIVALWVCLAAATAWLLFRHAGASTPSV